MAVGSDLIELDGILGDNEVHVWHIDLTAQEAALDRLSPLLDEDERARAARFIVPEPRVQFILSRAFLRIALGQYLRIEPGEVRFRTAERGKPELADERGVHFNLSHTEGATVIAVTRAGRVGVDVERIRENLEPLELAARFFSGQESEWLRSQPSAQRFAAFFACWTAKEAYVKACGSGLSTPLAGFGVIPVATDSELHLEIYGKPEESRRWSMWRLDLGPELRSAVAVEAVKCEVRVGQWSGSGEDFIAGHNSRVRRGKHAD
ncbi:MAG TPA: 4'-phosphopantetheinyl transferase superfamily protein [Terriglobales bacterium]|nr:4'-phosphopantetheinyl transferase superfamily protein [Terriglobales bacterium]